MKLLSILLFVVLFSFVLSRNINSESESEENSQSNEEEEEDQEDENVLGSCYRFFSEDLNDVSDENSDEGSEEILRQNLFERVQEKSKENSENSQEEDEDEEIPDWAGTGIIDFSKRWQKNDKGQVSIPYEIEKGYDKEDSKNIIDAMGMIEKDTCVKFRERNFDDKIYLFITHKENACFTYVGKFGSNTIRMAKHPVNFGKKVCKVGRMAHEFCRPRGLMF